jgi:selenide,water dikinase
MGPGALASVLNLLKLPLSPNLIAGFAPNDDAAVYRLTPDLALVQTLDFFPPIVDNPYVYGGIAAANAMSDVYAMGGEVLMGMNIVAFPDSLPHDVLAQILQGGADKMAEVGAYVVGGHTVVDREPKYGLSITGTVHPERVFTKGGAQAGDLLYLTKPLGTGIIISAYKHAAAYRAHYQAAIESMLRLNRTAAQLLQRLGIHACTDISGFSLLGHASEMAQSSTGVDLVLNLEQLPLLPGVRQYAEEGWLPSGIERNRTFLQVEPQPKVSFLQQSGLELEELAFGPETSGGLFFALAPEKADEIKAAFAEAGEPLWQIGYVQSGEGVVLID